MMTKWGKTVIVALMLAMGLVTVCLIACNSGQKSSPQTTKEKSADEQAAAKEDDDKTTSEEKATTAGQQDNKAKPSGPQPKI